MSSSQNLYPKLHRSNPNSQNKSNSSSSSSSLESETKYMAEKLFPTYFAPHECAFQSSQSTLIDISDSIVHLVDKRQSIQLAKGPFKIICLRQGCNDVAVFVRVGDGVQWPLAMDEAVIKLDDTHYFFTLRVPCHNTRDTGVIHPEEDIVNYGLTIVENSTDELDRVLGEYSAFTVKAVDGEVKAVIDGSGGTAEDKATAYWTTLAPNVEDYSGSVARLIGSGSGQLIKGISWCGDVTVDRLKWGDEFLKMRTKSNVGKKVRIKYGRKSDIRPRALKRMNRMKKMTEMSQNLALGLLSGAVKVSGFFTGSIVNSVPVNKFFFLLYGEIVLASLDGFNKLFDAVEETERNVMSTTLTVTTDLVSHKLGKDAAMDSAGVAVGKAWAVFKIQKKAMFPVSIIESTTSVKAAASQSSLSNSKT